MIGRSCLITTSEELRHSLTLGVTFACSDCSQAQFVTLELGAAGIALSDCAENLYKMLKLSPRKLSLEVTQNGNVLISCGYCKSGKTLLGLTPLPAGTLSLSENSSGEVKP